MAFVSLQERAAGIVDGFVDAGGDLADVQAVDALCAQHAGVPGLETWIRTDIQDKRAGDCFIDWLSEGADPDDARAVDSLLARHPELCNELLREVEFIAGPRQPTDEDLDDADRAAVQAELARLGERDDLAERLVLGAPIGHGGMSVVLGAVDNDLHRKVAVKVLNLEHKEVIEFPAGEQTPDCPIGTRTVRFLNEALITAYLDHPAVVPVYAIGADRSGRPYFCMKHIRGVTFDEFVKSVHAANTGEQLETALDHLMRIAQAVAFAHRHGIIHRDLKPANIMVDPAGGAYVMDWGLAKVLAGPARESMDRNGTLAGADEAQATQAASRPRSFEGGFPGLELTQARGAVPGTWQYMAPELWTAKVSASPESDVYSLGAVLFRLLTGQLPYAGHAAPPVGAPPPDVVALAQPGVHRELTRICERAMAAHPADRFGSAEAFERAIRNHVAATSQDRLEAIRQARRARLQASTYRGLVEECHPSRARGRPPTILDALDKLAERVSGGRYPTPDDKAYDLQTVGSLYSALGERRVGEEHLIEAVTLYTDLFDRLDCQVDLGAVMDRLRRDTTADFMRTTREELEQAVGRNDPLFVRQTYLLAEHLRRAVERFDEAEALYRELLDTRLEGERFQMHQVMARIGLGLIRLSQGDLDEAVRLLRRSYEDLVEEEDQDFPMTIFAAADLANALAKQGQFEESARILGEAVELQERVLGPDHPETFLMRNNLAKAKLGCGEAEEARQILDGVLTQLRQDPVDGDTTLMFVLGNMGLALTSLDRPREALPYHAECLEKAAGLSPTGPFLAQLRLLAADSLLAAGEVDEACRLGFAVLTNQDDARKEFRDAEALLKRALPRRADQTAESGLGHALHERGHRQLSRRWLTVDEWTALEAATGMEPGTGTEAGAEAGTGAGTGAETEAETGRGTGHRTGHGSARRDDDATAE